jgi:hypothetical protein
VIDRIVAALDRHLADIDAIFLLHLGLVDSHIGDICHLQIIQIIWELLFCYWL